MMKKLILLVAVMLAGCALPVQPLTPPQIVATVNAQVCPIAKAAILIAPTLQGVDAAALSKIADASKAVDIVCATGASLDGASLKALATTALPAVLNIARSVPNPDPNLIAVIDGLTIAQALLPMLVAQVEALK